MYMDQKVAVVKMMNRTRIIATFSGPNSVKPIQYFSINIFCLKLLNK